METHTGVIIPGAVLFLLSCGDVLRLARGDPFLDWKGEFFLES
jgi:hypothetical protein